jgi:hypothetical protein
MIGYVKDLVKIWDTLDTCYERPEKYIIKALKHIIKCRKYRVVASGEELSRVQKKEQWTTLSCSLTTEQSPTSWGRRPTLTRSRGVPVDLNGCMRG